VVSQRLETWPDYINQILKVNIFRKEFFQFQLSLIFIKKLNLLKLIRVIRKILYRSMRYDP